jgi:hypothetical protein
MMSFFDRFSPLKQHSVTSVKQFVLTQLESVQKVHAFKSDPVFEKVALDVLNILHEKVENAGKSPSETLTEQRSLQIR